MGSRATVLPRQGFGSVYGRLFGLLLVIVVAAFTVNELDDRGRAALLPALFGASDRGARVLVIEPLARRPVPWWDTWSEAFVSRGGRDDTWRLDAELPETLRLMDRAAGLDHRQLTGRTLFL